MQFDPFQKYLLAVNIFAFCIFTVDYVKYIQSESGIKNQWLCNLVVIAGGSVGTLAAFVFWDRKVGKQNVTSRVLVVCILIIQIVIELNIFSIIF